MEEVKGGLNETLKRFITAGTVGVFAALIGLGYAGLPAAIGAFGGAIAAAIYGDSFLRTHRSRMANGRQRLDSRLAGAALVRLMVIALMGFGAYLLGEASVKSYLVSLAATFGVVVVPPIFRAAKSLRVNRVGGTK